MSLSQKTLSQVQSSPSTAHVPFSDTELLALAPLALPSYRATRYQADDICVSLNAFSAHDQHTLRQIYTVMGELLGVMKTLPTAPSAQAEALVDIQNFVHRRRWVEFIASVREIGNLTDTWQPSEDVRKVIHDIKGGCFVSVSIILQLIDLGLAQQDDVQRLFFATRDYLKIMRSSVSDLDPQGYAKDRAYKVHSAKLLVDKWQQAPYRVHDTLANIVLDCRFTGDISERCLEFAALDRILYNVINNAAKNTTDKTIYITMLAMPEDQPDSVRFVIANRIMAEHQRVLEKRYGERLGELFLGGFTTGGTGLGMYICADLVTKAYGLSSIEQGIEKGYIGARCISDHFVNWFHWPIVVD